MYVLLEELNKVQEKIKDMDVLNENYYSTLDLMLKLISKFDMMSAKYYISPAARTKMVLDMSAVKKTQAETESITSKLIKNKKA